MKAGLGKMRCAAIVAVLMAGWADPASADVNQMGTDPVVLKMVDVGGPGNLPDTRNVPTGIGCVNQPYQIGKYEVTNGQYCTFLNAVAAIDINSVYNWHSGIERTMANGVFLYRVKPGYDNRPVDNVAWGSAARFCNWLTNGQPAGSQSSATTEDGVYEPKNATNIRDLMTVTRKGRGYVIPTADEWYKAAYYKGGSINAGYWDYPTADGIAPTRNLPPGTSGSANFYSSGHLDPLLLTTEVGAYSHCASAYGTFDQAGNVFEWTEATKGADYRLLRGGSYDDANLYLRANSNGLAMYPCFGDATCGLRVACTIVPEPTTLAVLSLALAGLVAGRRRQDRFGD